MYVREAASVTLDEAALEGRIMHEDGRCRGVLPSAGSGDLAASDAAGTASGPGSVEAACARAARARAVRDVPGAVWLKRSTITLASAAERSRGASALAADPACASLVGKSPWFVRHTGRTPSESRWSLASAGESVKQSSNGAMCAGIT